MSRVKIQNLKSLKTSLDPVPVGRNFGNKACTDFQNPGGMTLLIANDPSEEASFIFPLISPKPLLLFQSQIHFQPV